MLQVLLSSIYEERWKNIWPEPVSYTHLQKLWELIQGDSRKNKEELDKKFESINENFKKQAEKFDKNEESVKQMNDRFDKSEESLKQTNEKFDKSEELSLIHI